MTEKVIALDIGNVCIGIHPERCFGALGFRSLADIPREVLFLAGERFERGEISEAEFLDGFRRLTGSALSDAELRRAFCAIIGEPVPGMAELVSGLAGRGYRPVFFSDTSVTHMEELRRKFPGRLRGSGRHLQLPGPCEETGAPDVRGVRGPFRCSGLLLRRPRRTDRGRPETRLERTSLRFSGRSRQNPRLNRHNLLHLRRLRFILQPMELLQLL